MADQIVSWGGFDSKGTDGMGITGSLSVDGSTFISSSNATQLQVGNNSLFVSSSGNVGIGTTSPSEKLHVYGSGALIQSPSYLDAGFTISDDIYDYRIGTTPPQVRTNYIHIQRNASNTRFAHSGGAFIWITGATEVARISAAGNVGIGTTTPTSRLHVKGSGTTDATTAFRVENANASGSMVVLDNGNVGIGTTTPSASLHVVGSAKLTNALYLGGNTDMIDPSSNSGFMTIGSNQPIRFTNASSTEFIRITTAGNVGIGTTSPSQKLEVAGNVLVTTSGSTQPLKTFEATYKQFSVDYPSTPSAFTTQLNFGLLGRLEYNGNGGVLSIENRSTQAGSSMMRFVMGTTERMRITDTGNVGIGTTTPTSRLHVKGSGTTDATTSFLLEDSSGTERFKVLDSGKVRT
jgi:hypothetical protein